MKSKDCICVFLLLVLFYLITSKNNIVENMEDGASDDKGLFGGVLDTAVELSGLGGLIGGGDDTETDNTSSDEIEDDFVQNDNMLDTDDVYLKEDYDKVDSSSSMSGSGSERPPWLPRMPPYIRNDNDEKDVVANILYQFSRNPDYSDHKDILKKEAKLLMTSNKSLKNVGETLRVYLPREDVRVVEFYAEISEEIATLKRLAPKSPPPKSKSPPPKSKSPPPKSKALFKQEIIDSVVETCQTMGFIDPSRHGNQENKNNGCGGASCDEIENSFNNLKVNKNNGCGGESCDEIEDGFRKMGNIVDKCEEMDREYRDLKKDYEKNMNKCGPETCEEINKAFRSLKDENIRLNNELNKMIG